MKTKFSSVVAHGVSLGFFLVVGLLTRAEALPLVATPTTRCGFPAAKHPVNWSTASFYAANQIPSAKREVHLVREILSGNVPDRLRQMSQIILKSKWKSRDVMLSLEVTPDYLMIGTNSDFVRAPLTNYAAQYLASELGFSMPTPYLVDQIYAQAKVQMVPQPTDWYKVSIDMRLGSNYIVFNNTVETQLAGREILGLVAGHKKDVVLTNRLDAFPTRVAIYGWQQPGGKPIQPLGTPHGYEYEDYSHGIRWLGPTLKISFVDTGEVVEWSLPQALNDPELGNILNGGQGAIHDVRAARTCTAEFKSAMGIVGACPRQPVICANLTTAPLAVPAAEGLLY